MREIDEGQATRLERYLLGDLPDEEIHRIESQLLHQPALFTQVEAIEDELVDRYVRDELSSNDRRHFEEHLLPSSRIQQRVAFARSLHRLTEDAEPETGLGQVTPFRTAREARRPSFVTRLAWAACLVGVLGAGALALVNLRLQNDLDHAVQQQHTATVRAAAAEEQVSSLTEAVESSRADGAEKEALERELADSRNQIAALEQRTKELERTARQTARPEAPAERSAASKVLFLAFTTRGGEGPTTLELPVPHGAELQLDLDRLPTKGELTVTVSRAGMPVWMQSGLAPEVFGSDAMLPVTLPQPVLLPGAYRIEIRESDREDADPIATYDFVVVR